MKRINSKLSSEHSPEGLTGTHDSEPLRPNRQDRGDNIGGESLPDLPFYETGPDIHSSLSRQTRLELEVRAAHYAALYDYAPAGYFRLNRGGIIVEANLTGAGMLGMTRSALTGRRLEDFVPLDMQAAYGAFIRQIFRGDAKESCELTFVAADRRPFFAHVEANPEELNHTCRIVLCDISERKQAELGLIEREERFRLMADSAPVLIWITGSRENYLWFNKMWLDFTGQRLEDELGYGWMRNIHPEDLQAVRDGQYAAFLEKRPFTLEYRLRKHDGQYHYMLAHGVPRTSMSGKFLGYIGSSTDISERKKVEEALRHSRQMLRHLVSYQERVREDERKRIAREIHDELGQNLLALRLDVAMLHTRTAGTHSRLNQRVTAALNNIDATMKAVRAAINNLRPAVLDLGLNAAIEWLVTDFKRRSGIDCHLVMGDDVKLDDNRATALFRILQESLNNVVRHAQAREVLIELYKDENNLLMKIADDGVGIYPSCRRKPHSFGLVGIEERINALGGAFSIESDPERGTALSITLPLPIA